MECLATSLEISLREEKALVLNEDEPERLHGKAVAELLRAGSFNAAPFRERSACSSVF